MRAGRGGIMVIAFEIAEYGAAYVGAFIGAVAIMLMAPNDATKCGCAMGSVAFIAFILMIITATVMEGSEYYAYEYDKVLAKREHVMAACPDMSNHLCLEKYHAYQRDSLNVYERYMNKRKE